MGALAFIIRVAAVTAVIVALALLAGGVTNHARNGALRTEATRAAPPARLERGTEAPIEAEARVFRVAAAAPNATPSRRNTAHPRTLKTFRALREYPGAPPRVPHGLTRDEFRTTRCKTCHERGGYSIRFGAYAPVTPHPEMTNCLQCHLADAALVGISPPLAGGDSYCRQCHTPGARREPAGALEWRTTAWPRSSMGAAGNGMPPVIPHELHMRSNCLACHDGPGAVAEIRTDHPERLNCRQCHLEAAPAIQGVDARGVQ